MKRILTLVLSMLMLLSIAGAADAKTKHKGKSKKATAPEVQATKKGPIPAEEVERSRKSGDSDTPVVSKPGPVPVGPPIELHLTRADSRRFDLRSLPHTPPILRERTEPADPVIAPSLIQGVLVPPDQSRPSVPAANIPAPAPLNVFEGLDRFTWGAGSPPDTNGDAGPNDYIQTVNTSIGIFNKSTGAQKAAFTAM